MKHKLLKFHHLTLIWLLPILTLLSSCTQSTHSPQLLAPRAPTQPAQLTSSSRQAAAPQTLEGRVVGVADGDTLTVLDAGNRQTRVRLLGIDAPESRQAFGEVSKRNLSDLVFNKHVVIEYEKTDRHGRTLGKVVVGDRDVNLLQVKGGLAWHYKYYQDEQSSTDRRLYAEAETEARAARRGLWADSNPTPPWDFRRGKRISAEEGGPTEDDATKPTPTPSVKPTGTQADGATEWEEETVYVTRTGSKYHRLSCQYLRHSRISMPLKDAKRSYEPCSVCKPSP